MKRQPFHHPSAWKATDFSGKSDVCEQLGQSHVAAFERALDSVSKRKLEIEEVTRDDFPLNNIQDSVDRWVDLIQEGRGLLVLTGFPINKYSKDECATIYWGLGTHFGEAQSQSPMDDRLGQVVDVGGKDARERAYRNSLELALHTDGSDIIGMMCLVKASKGGLSGYSSGPAIYNYMLETDPELLDVLFVGFYYHLFGEQPPGESPVTTSKVPVFSECQGYLSVSYLRSYIELAFDELKVEKTALELRALDTFDEIAHSPEFRLDFMMEPGDIAFFNNYTVLHTRTEFFDHADPDRKRHMLRLWLRAWKPRPIKEALGPYIVRDGIPRQEGRGTYYTGNVEYHESPPSKVE